MELRLVYSAIKGEFAEACAKLHTPIAVAATAAITEAAAYIKIEGRNRIAGAGFSRRWQNAFRVNVYPEHGRVSVDAALFAYHKIPYSGIFEDGGKISGSPLLWIPLSNIKFRISGKRLTPRLFVEMIGPLHSVNVPGRPPMLAAYVSTATNPGSLTAGKLKAGAKRRAARGVGSVQSVPIFYGINTVEITAKFHLHDLFNRARDMLPALYLKHRAKDKE